MQCDQLKRREFLSLLGVAAAWPLAADAQQPALPVIGFINVASPEALTHRLTAFRQGLSATGYLADQDRIPVGRGALRPTAAMAADLVRRRVAVIAATSTAAPLAAKAATAVTPIVFETASDPIRLGLVGNRLQ